MHDAKEADTIKTKIAFFRIFMFFYSLSVVWLQSLNIAKVFEII